MSLTSQLDDLQSPIRQFMDTQFPYGRQALRSVRKKLIESKTIEPDGTIELGTWGILGTALDYRIRYYFAITPVQKFVAWQ